MRIATFRHLFSRLLTQSFFTLCWTLAGAARRASECYSHLFPSAERISDHSFHSCCSTPSWTVTPELLNNWSEDSLIAIQSARSNRPSWRTWVASLSPHSVWSSYKSTAYYSTPSHSYSVAIYSFRCRMLEFAWTMKELHWQIRRVFHQLYPCLFTVTWSPRWPRPA